MNINGHMKYGLISSSVLSVLSFVFILPSVINSALIFISTLAGSLVPDLDISSVPSKWAGRILSGIIAFTLTQALIARYIYDLGYTLDPYFVLFLALIFTIAKSGKHRGITHMYTIPVALMAFSIELRQITLMVFSIGLIVHYVCDSMSPFSLNSWTWKPALNRES